MTSFRKDDAVGKTVIETTGRVQGKVTDVVFDLSGGVTLIVEGEDDRNSQVPLTRVTGISEHVVIRRMRVPGGSHRARGHHVDSVERPSHPGKNGAGCFGS